jgi:RNA polymerase sigma factor (TIGR02999 family)
MATGACLWYRSGVDDRGILTDLIQRAQRGDSGAAQELLDATYQELRRLARARLRAGGRSLLLDTTALVNEWYVRFAEAKGAELQDRVHFMRYASRVMRSVIVDFARRRLAGKRGGQAQHTSLTVQVAAEDGRWGEAEIVRVHDALVELSKLDERMAQVVEMRYFGGMTEPEIAEALNVAERTVRRDWEKARLWLAEALR